MKKYLFKLFLLSLLCAAWPGRVGAEMPSLQAVRLTNTAIKEQNTNASKITAQYRHKPTGPTKGEKTMSLFFLALLVLGIVALIAGLIEGSNVLIPVLIVGGSVLYLLIMTRILKARKKKNKGKTPTAPAKK